MRESETGIGGDGAIKGCRRAWVERQHKIAALDVGVLRHRR